MTTDLEQDSLPRADQAERTRIYTDTDATLFVEAGAGSGKTTCLIERVSTLVLREGIPLSRIVAITFTERAGAELRDRLRTAFDDAASDAGGDHERRQQALRARTELDAAAVGTLHSFAQRILTMYPIQAKLPPLLEVSDEVASSVAFEDRWSVMMREILDDAQLSEPLLLALSTGVKLDHLRSLARAFGNDWDLIADRVLPQPPVPAEFPPIDELILDAARLSARSDECGDEADLFLQNLEALREWGQRLSQATNDQERFTILVEGAELKWGRGRTANWPDLAGLRSSCQELARTIGQVRSLYVELVLRPLAYRIAEGVLTAARERTARGTLEFHDLLVLTRDLLRHDAVVRDQLQQQYPRILLDEFQDTDPIQIEIAVRIAAGSQGGAADWTEVPVPSGSLFMVGDPKQSIYRFRRASIETYLTMQDRLGEPVALTTNFRSVQPILDWVNAAFGRIITASTGSQPGFRALNADRQGVPSGPAVALLGRAEHTDRPTAGILREREAHDVAAILTAALRDGWSVLAEANHPDSRPDAEGVAWRPIRPGDIAVLLPSRTSLPFLEAAFDEARLPYRAESSSLVYQAPEVRSLMAAARVLADPADGLACVTALRSPMFGCGDDDLWTYRRDGGSFNILAPRPPMDATEEGLRAGHPVVQGLAYLRRLYWASRWATPSEILTTLLTDRRMLEVASTDRRGRDHWRRLRFVIDQARAWSDVQAGGLREYLTWAARQADETARVAEAVLPETDLDVIRVMTVHAAKGLEFPMVVLSGMTSRQRTMQSVKLLWHSNGYAARLSSTMQTNDFAAQQPLDEQMDEHERRRLLYVGSTRARDHLVVSLHRAGNARTNAAIVADAVAAGASAAHNWVSTSEFVQLPSPPVADRPPPPPTHADWAARIGAAQTASRHNPAQNASGLEGTEPAIALTLSPRAISDADPESGGTAKGARDLALPVWSKGRYGTAIGRAVHGVLQSIDLATSKHLAAAVRVQAIAEGVTAHQDIIEGLSRSALETEHVQRAARNRHWRESYVATQQSDGTILEGYLDLMYEDDDGSLVILDYKTDAIPHTALEARASYYAPQLRAYRRAVSDAVRTNRQTTAPTLHTVLLFLHPDQVGLAYPVL